MLEIDPETIQVTQRNVTREEKLIHQNSPFSLAAIRSGVSESSNL